MPNNAYVFINVKPPQMIKLYSKLILTHISYFCNTFFNFRIKTKKHLKSGAYLFARLSIENRIKDNGNEGKETQVI